MICKMCGANLPDNVKFCTKCGSKVMAEPAVNPAFSAPQQSAAPQQFVPQQSANTMAFGGEAVAPAPKKKSASKIIIPIVAVILVAALAVGAYFMFFSKPYKGALDDYFKAIETQDGDLLKESMPDFMSEVMQLAALFGGEDAYKQLAIEQHEYFASWVEGADDIKISYTIKGDEKEIKEEDLDLDELEMFGVDVEIEEAYEIELEVTVKGDGEEKTDDVTAYAIKEKDGWAVFVEG